MVKNAFRLLLILIALFSFAGLALATQITVQSTTVPNWQNPTAAPRLRIYLSKPVTTSDNRMLQSGSPQSGVAYQTITCSVAGGVLTIPQFTIDSLNDAAVGSDATYSAYFYTSAGQQIVDFRGFTKFTVPAGPTTTSWAAISIYNSAPLPARPPMTYTREQINALVSSAGNSVATFLLSTPDATLTNGFALSSLATGLLKNTTGTGVPSIAVAGTDYLSPTGSGALLTALNASSLASGTIPDARFPSTLPAASGVNLTSLNASNLASGTVADGRLSANVSLLGSSIDLSGAEATGILAAGRFPALTGDITSSSGSLATTLAGTIAGAHTFTGNIDLTVIDTGGQVFNVTAAAYVGGADPTGVADSQPAIAAAIAAAVAAKKGIVYFPPGTYKINSPIIVGNGTSTTISTYAAIQLIGAGGTRLSNVTPASAVKIQWNGAPGGIMIDVRGPIGGFKIEGIYLEANGTNRADTCVKIMHAQEALVDNISGWGFGGVGLDIDSWGISTFNVTPGPPENTFSYGDGGTIRHCSFISTVAGSTGLRLGKTGTIANWGISDSTFSLSGATTAGIELRHTDHAVFTNVLATAEAGVRIKPISGVTAFPMNTFFYGGSVNGAHATTTANGAIGAGDTTITVVSTTGFPSAGVAQIIETGGNTETFIYSGKTATTLTGVSRGQYSTSAVAHVTGTTVAVAMDVVIDNTDATWSPTTGYGIRFDPFATADGAIVPTDTRIYGESDKRRIFGGGYSVDFPFHVGNVSSAALSLSDGIRFQGADGANSIPFITDVYGGTAANIITGRMAGGTALTPTATPANAFLIGLSGRGYDTAFATGSKGLIAIKAAALWSATSNPTYITFETTLTGDAAKTRNERMRILDSGRILINTTTDNGADQLQVTGGFSVSGTIKAGSGPTTLTDSAGKILSAALNTVAVAQGGTGITSFGSGVATWLGTPSSANLASATPDETGSGPLVFATSPTLTNPTLNLDDAATNAMSTIATYNHNTSGTPAAGFGSTVLWNLESTTETNADAASIGVEWLSATGGGSEDAAFVIKTALAGTLTENLRISAKSGNAFTRTMTGTINTVQLAAQLGLDGGTMQAGGGPSMAFFADDSGGTKEFLGRVSGVWEIATDGSEAGAITFSMRTTGDTFSQAEGARFTSALNLKIGGTAARGTTEGTQQLVLFNGTAPAGTLTNGVSLYSASGELRVMDAAGNSTLLSPHDDLTNEWIFYSKNTVTGKVLRIDVERMFKFLNSYFGTDFIREYVEPINQ